MPPILQEANFAFTKGEYGRAAELFEQIAAPRTGAAGSALRFFICKAGRSRVPRRGKSHWAFPPSNADWNYWQSAGNSVDCTRAEREHSPNWNPARLQRRSG
ncbi:MAG: hypothetical protein MZV63_06910 [Marinilabiliales bacterium]|nr:hypothetical protein [Marinilabiliales bacterium]